MPMKEKSLQKKIMNISTGTARQNSTMTPETALTILLGSNRPMPKSRPKTTEPMTASVAALMVIHSPGR